MKILIADDNRSTRLLLVRTLARWGYQVFEASDGEEAWRVLSRERIQLLISDWEMPELDGPSLCRRIRGDQAGRYVYILLLTGRGEPAHIVEGLESGSDDFLTKPFNPAELQARIGVGRRILALQDELASRNELLAAANSELERVAATDPLTHVGNRRSFDEALERAHLSAHDGGRYAVLMIDVDRFKSYNDRYGHTIGDRVLAGVARAVRGATQGDGRLFRYGGEEFAFIAPDISADRLPGLAERVRSCIEATRIEHDPPLSVTASVGAAHFRGGMRSGEVVERADAALYQAKHDGRNRVRIASNDSDAHVAQST